MAKTDMSTESYVTRIKTEHSFFSPKVSVVSLICLQWHFWPPLIGKPLYGGSLHETSDLISRLDLCLGMLMRAAARAAVDRLSVPENSSVCN